MIHHVSLGTNDVARARAFYDPVLAVVSIRRMKTADTALDYGVGAYLISLETPVDGNSATPGNGARIAFAAEDKATVDEG